MNGFVDDRNRALLPIQVASSLKAEPLEVLVWIDTAFDGHLVFSKELISKLQLDSLVETEAVLADGSKITMESYFCVVDWFGQKVPVQVIENDGKFPCWELDFLTAKRFISATTRKPSPSLEWTNDPRSTSRGK